MVVVADQKLINSTIYKVLNSETATEIFSKTFQTVRKFDPHNVPMMLHFIEHLVFEYSKLTEPYKVEIDGIQTSFKSQKQFMLK